MHANTLAWMQDMPKTERFFEGMRFLFTWLAVLALPRCRCP